ncbi:MAG: alkaline phosphatase family protein [Alphaproteobacteria bacterium]|nr:alkaline phosphatase family protein [Alphaproteobacteria bacterium]
MRRAVLVICDGHRADFVRPELTPHICALAARGRRFAEHRGIFPSVTRTSSASIATGCHPGRHGLHGNTMALDEGDGLVTRDVGNPDFRTRMRKATGATLRVPTVAERIADLRGQIVFSNVSPGAAIFHDPDGYGHVYHRAISYGPGESAVADPLKVSHDAAGDAAMTERFCREILRDRRPTVSVLWLCEPDHTMHASELGSPDHLAAIRAADACVGRVAETVDALRAEGEDILLLVGSDHGQETVGETIRLDALLVEAGLKESLTSTDVAIAPQGFSGLVSLAAGLEARAADIAKFLRGQDWIGDVFDASDLARIGQAPTHGLALAFTLRGDDRTNSYGVPGYSPIVMASSDERVKAGLGSHGGLGRWEQSPFLVAQGGPVPATGAAVTAPTCIVDIAPTILRHLGRDATGMDGKALDFA